MNDQNDDDLGRERRSDFRFQLNLPAQMNGQGYHDIEMVDISATGMRIRSGDVDIFKGEGYSPNRKDRLNIHLEARLAWAEPQPDGGFLTGWRFEQVDTVQQTDA